MENNIDNLKNFIERLKTIGFFSRLFSWKRIKRQLIDAIVDIQNLTNLVKYLTENNIELKNLNLSLNKDLDLAKMAGATATAEISNLKSVIDVDRNVISDLNSNLASKNANIESLNGQINQFSNSLELINQKNEQLFMELGKSSEELAVKNEGIVKISERKAELESINLLVNQKMELQIEDSKKLSQELATYKEALKKVTERKNELESQNDLLAHKNIQLGDDGKKYSEEIATFKESLSKIDGRKNQLEIEVQVLRNDLSTVRSDRDLLKQLNIQLQTEEEGRRKKYENETAAVASVRQQIQDDRNHEIEERNIAEVERIKNLKETWTNHQITVKGLLKGIANKHLIECIGTVPFKGDPDVTLRICDEFVIFDAKSPGGEELTNFPSYLKEQAEKAKKYAKQDGVKKDIFFVVPTNTLQVIKQFVINLTDYDVFIISVDSLEQVVLSLKRIEGYEFAEMLSPEERDNICRILGKFAHLTKRRIQIDSFFAKQFLELAYKSEADLPKEILDRVIEFEKSEKLNPPIERRTKTISIKELDKDASKLQTELSAKGLVIDEIKISSGLNDLQLYQNDNEI